MYHIRIAQHAVSVQQFSRWLWLDDLPQWDWYDINAHLRCTECGSVGYVDTRRDLSEVIDFNKGIS